MRDLTMPTGLRHVMILILALLTPGVVWAEAPMLRWVHNLDDAKKLATDEHKDLLVNFTGLEWCQWCRVLHDNILVRDEFGAAANDFVLVDLDFPADLDDLGPLKDPYASWVQKYLIRANPTIVLADESGRPYAYLTGAGCAEEANVTSFLASLGKLRNARLKRDQELAAAENSTGLARAAHLSAALESIDAQLEDFDRHNDDPLVVFYRPEIDEICRLDADNALKLRASYEARLKLRETFVGLLAVLDECYEKQNYANAMARIDQALTEVKDGNIRFQLEQKRCAFLEELGRNEEAMALLRRLVDDPYCPTGDRDWMLRNIAICLRRMERIDEAAACYDQQIAAATNRDSRRYFQRSKAELMRGADRHAEAIELCRVLLSTAKPDSEEWATDQGRLAGALVAAGQRDEALVALRQQKTFWRAREDLNALLGLAREQHASDFDDLASETLDDAEALLDELAREATNERKIARLRDQLTTLRAQLAATPDAPQPGAK
jgi:tetratricopeptide (TPR) repeat protein